MQLQGITLHYTSQAALDMLLAFQKSQLGHNALINKLTGIKCLKTSIGQMDL